MSGGYCFSMESFPKKFGKFILLDKIASGGMAEIFLAQTTGPSGFEKMVALKRILPAFSANTEFLSMFIDEAKVTSQLTHSNIVQIYEFGQIGPNYYLSMEYVDGKNLRQILSRSDELKRPIPLEHAVYIINQVCEGIDYAHRFRDKKMGDTLHIIHRDISPQNILIAYEGEIKLIDFGIAKTKKQDGKTKSGVLKGKFGYMSPEQACGEPLDRGSDIFSTGIILFEMITRQRLFAAANDLATLKKIQEAKIPPPRSFNPDIPPELENIVLKALVKDPSKRYQTAHEFHLDLTRFLYTLNPEFTTNHLALYLRSLFALEILEHKKQTHEILLKLGQMDQALPTTSTQDQEFTQAGTEHFEKREEFKENSNRKIWLQIAFMGLAVMVLSFMLLYLNYRSDRMIQSEPPQSLEPESTLKDAESNISLTNRLPPVNENLVSDDEVGIVHFQTIPESEIYIDGKKIGKTPITYKLPLGKHHIKAINAEFNLVSEKEIEVRLNDELLMDEKVLVFHPAE